MEVTAERIAQHFNGEIIGDPQAKVSSVAKIESGKSGNICFLANPKYEKYLYTSKASIVIINRCFKPDKPVEPTLILVDNAYEAVASLLDLLNALKRARRSGRSLLSRRGNNCIIHANAVIGSDGFGFAPTADGSYKKIPQTGNVVIEDDVEIGANTVIDRATMGSTTVRRGVKLDNLIQVAHNVEIGENTVIAAQSGIAGSTKIGKGCQFGGQVGIIGHATIADGVQVGAQAGVQGSVRREKATLLGTPAIDYMEYMRAYALFRKAVQNK